MVLKLIFFSRLATATQSLDFRTLQSEYIEVRNIEKPIAVHLAVKKNRGKFDIF